MSLDNTDTGGVAGIKKKKKEKRLGTRLFSKSPSAPKHWKVQAGQDIARHAACSGSHDSQTLHIILYRTSLNYIVIYYNYILERTFKKLHFQGKKAPSQCGRKGKKEIFLV